MQGILLYIHAVHQHLTSSRVVKSGDQLNQTGLSASCSSDNSKGLTWFCCKANLSQHQLRFIIRIAETYISKLHPSLCNQKALSGSLSISQINLCIHNFIDTLYRGHSSGALKKYHGQHHKGHKNLYNIGSKGS